MKNERQITKKDSQALLKKAQKWELKHGDNLTKKQRKNLRQTIDLLKKALDNDEALEKPHHKLETLLDDHSEEELTRMQRFWKEGRSIFTAVLVAILLRIFIVEPFKIPSGSMIPTLQIGDHLFVNKLAYGLWIPFVQKKWIWGQPQRGDVIVFVSPIDPSRDMVKRVIGLPGDSIVVKDNVVFVNGKPLPQKKKGSYTYQDKIEEGDWFTKQGVLFEERTKARRYLILKHPNDYSPLRFWDAATQAQNSQRPWGPKVKKGFLFVMGDNRDKSSDSRDWGLVPLENIKGRAFLVWLSFGPHGIRTHRFFSIIH